MKGDKINLKTRFIEALCLFLARNSESPGHRSKKGNMIKFQRAFPQGKAYRIPKANMTYC